MDHGTTFRLFTVTQYGVKPPALVTPANRVSLNSARLRDQNGRVDRLIRDCEQSKWNPVLVSIYLLVSIYRLLCAGETYGFLVGALLKLYGYNI